MNFKLIGILVLWGFPAFANIVCDPSEIVSIAVGRDNSCVLKKDAVKCYGSNAFGLAITKTGFINAKKVVVGTRHACVLDDLGVSCFGSNMYRQQNIPKLSNPKVISAGNNHTCAIDDTGLHCWGANHGGQLSLLPTLTNPHLTSSGLSYNCAVDDNQTICWGGFGGSYGHGRHVAPLDLEQSVAIASGWFHTCALDINDHVRCWQDEADESNRYPRLSNIPALKGVKILAAGGMQACAVDSTGLHCWGDSCDHTGGSGIDGISCNTADGGGASPPANLVNIRDLSVGVKHSCALDSEGVKCWGDSSGGETAVPLCGF